MSYDIQVGSYDFNYTSNMAKMFYDHMDGGLHSLHGKTGSQAAKIIASCFDGFYRDYTSGTQFRSKYDAPNGWGSTDGAMIFLARIMAACHASPRSKVKVWA